MNEADEDDIVPMAIAGLYAATQEMLESGMPKILVEGNQLVRNEGGKKTVLRELPPEPMVTNRLKRIRQV